MSGSRPRLIELPDGLRVWALSDLETTAFYYEIFVTQSYVQHGIKVADGACVFDVGANNGLFSIFLARSHSRLRLFAFEPIPRIFSALQRNARLHLNGSSARLFRCGLSHTNGWARFETDGVFAQHGTMRRAHCWAAVRKDTPSAEWVAATVRDLERISRLSPRIAARLFHALSVFPLDRVVVGCFGVLWLWTSLRRRVTSRRVRCPLRTLSDVIAEHRVDRIDLLKIDVEGSELDVLNGIKSEDWPKIRQLVVEVHDFRGRAAGIADRLRGLGFRITVGSLDWELHRLLGIVMLYATRAANGSSSRPCHPVDTCLECSAGS